MDTEFANGFPWETSGRRLLAGVWWFYHRFSLSIPHFNRPLLKKEQLEQQWAWNDRTSVQENDSVLSVLLIAVGLLFWRQLTWYLGGLRSTKHGTEIIVQPTRFVVIRTTICFLTTSNGPFFLWAVILLTARKIVRYSPFYLGEVKFSPTMGG